MKGASVVPPVLNQLHWTRQAHEHEKYQHALQRIDDVEYGGRRFSVERNYFENPINRHNDCQERCALHAETMSEKRC